MLDTSMEVIIRATVAWNVRSITTFWGALGQKQSKLAQ